MFGLKFFVCMYKCIIIESKCIKKQINVYMMIL